MEYNGVLIATPRAEIPNPRYWHGILTLQAWASARHVRWGYNEVSDKNGVATNHNKLCEHFLETDYEWMFMMDSDALLHPLSLERLLSWEKKAVVPLMFRNVPPYLPTVFKEPIGDPEDDKWKQDFQWIHDWIELHYDQTAVMDQPVLLTEARGEPLEEIQTAGTHVALVHREVLEDIDPPYFEAKKERGTGSDFYFWRKVRAAGYELWCDKTVFSGHLQHDYCIGPVDYIIWSAVTPSARRMG